MKNPESNTIIEWIHLIVLNMLHTHELSDYIWDDEDRIWDFYLAKISQAIHTTFNTITKYTPSHLVFNRDMILQFQRMINLDLIISNKKIQQFEIIYKKIINGLHGHIKQVIKFYSTTNIVNQINYILDHMIF